MVCELLVRLQALLESMDRHRYRGISTPPTVLPAAIETETIITRCTLRDISCIFNQTGLEPSVTFEKP